MCRVSLPRSGPCPEPFTRLHAWDQIPGAGLGLPIAERVVVRHGGDVTLESEEGVGTTVRVRWPA